MRTCIINNHLPNYVIPERNLIASRLTLQSKQQLVYHLEVLLKEGRNIFCKLTIFIKHSPLSLVLAPCSVFFYGRKRDDVEKLWQLIGCLGIKNFQIDQLFRTTGYIECVHKLACDQRSLPLNFKLINLVVPEWMTLGESGQIQVFCDLYIARLQQYLL